jgi:hypothetical protein
MCRIPGQVVLGRFHIYEYGVFYQEFAGLRVANLDNFWIAKSGDSFYRPFAPPELKRS